jgi:hypothetical protein
MGHEKVARLPFCMCPTVLISGFTLCYGPGLLFRGPLCILQLENGLHGVYYGFFMSTSNSLTLLTATYSQQYKRKSLLRFHDNNDYAKETQRYVIRTIIVV